MKPDDDSLMRILLCANPPYFQHLATAVASVSAANPGRQIDVHVIYCERDEVAEARLSATIATCRDMTLTLHLADDARISGFFVDNFMTKECYLRLLAAEILPQHIEKVLYLDSDIVVVGDLGPLWGTPLAGKVVAAAPDYPLLRSVTSPERRALLGIPQDALYVNSGVMLMDLAEWRRRNLTDTMFEYVARMGPALEFYDQDAVNAVLHDDILLLDPRWNLQARIYRAGRRAFPRDYEATREARRNPAIIHYTGSEKPWKFRSRTARKGDYLRNLARTAWRHERPSLAGPIQRAEYAMDRALSRAGIDYLQVLYLGRRLWERATQRSTGPEPRLAPVVGGDAGGSTGGRQHP
jgi:lipopolysaccharide biosynthesis glycosyltransferase